MYITNECKFLDVYIDSFIYILVNKEADLATSIISSFQELYAEENAETNETQKTSGTGCEN